MLRPRLRERKVSLRFLDTAGPASSGTKAVALVIPRLETKTNVNFPPPFCGFVGSCGCRPAGSRVGPRWRGPGRKLAVARGATAARLRRSQTAGRDGGAIASRGATAGDGRGRSRRTCVESERREARAQARGAHRL